MSSALDRSVLQHLQMAVADHSGAFVARLVATYGLQSETQVVDLERAASARDLTGLRFAAHSLKGGSATMGGVRLAALCQELEHWTGSLDELTGLVRTVRLEADQLRAELASYLLSNQAA